MNIATVTTDTITILSPVDDVTMLQVASTALFPKSYRNWKRNVLWAQPFKNCTYSLEKYFLNMHRRDPEVKFSFSLLSGKN